MSFAAVSCAVVAIAALLTAQGPANEFTPDTTFSGSSLNGWTTLGAVDWQAQSGEIVGRPQGKPGRLARARQVVPGRQLLHALPLHWVRARRACCSGCGRPTTGMTGVYVSLADGDLKTYRVTLDAEGRITRRATRCVRPRRFSAWRHRPRLPMRMRRCRARRLFRWSARAAAADP